MMIEKTASPTPPCNPLRDTAGMVFGYMCFDQSADREQCDEDVSRMAQAHGLVPFDPEQFDLN